MEKIKNYLLSWKVLFVFALIVAAAFIIVGGWVIFKETFTHPLAIVSILCITFSTTFVFVSDTLLLNKDNDDFKLRTTHEMGKIFFRSFILGAGVTFALSYVFFSFELSDSAYNELNRYFKSEFTQNVRIDSWFRDFVFYAVEARQPEVVEAVNEIYADKKITYHELLELERAVNEIRAK